MPPLRPETMRVVVSSGMVDRTDTCYDGIILD